MYTFYSLFIVQSHKTYKCHQFLRKVFLGQNVSLPPFPILPTGTKSSFPNFYYLLPTFNKTFILFLLTFTTFYHLLLIAITFQQFFPTFYHLSATLYYFLSIKTGSISFCTCLALLISSTPRHKPYINNRFRMITIRIVIIKATITEIYINNIIS